MKKLFFILLIASLSVSFFISCKKEEPTPDEPIQEEILEKDKDAKIYLKPVMDDIYYWYNKIPKNIDRTPLDIFAYFDTLLYKTEDRWSWMMTGEEFLNEEQGISEGYGLQIVQAIDYYNDYGIRVAFVYPSSPAAQNGVQRGWELTKINGTPVMDLIKNGQFYAEIQKTSNTFTFLDLSRTEKTFTVAAQTFTSRSVLNSKIYTNDDFPGLSAPVGYMHYLTFNAKMLSDIDDVMEQFKAAGVTNVILDLRYNSGGDGDATEHLANYLAPQSANNQILSKYKHNSNNSQYDSNTASIIKREAGALDLTTLYVISGKYTASASEVIINGLKPFMNVVQVGQTTYGKPAGMYVIPYPESDYDSPEYVFLPISFMVVNKDGNGDYLNGIVPDNYRADDVFHDFGKDEDLIHACLTHIKSGEFPPLPELISTKSARTVAAHILPEQPKRFLYKINFKKLE